MNDFLKKQQTPLIAAGKHSSDDEAHTNSSPQSDDRPSILFVTPSTPFARKSGTEQRSSLIYEALKQIGTVDVVLLTEGAPQEASSTTSDNGRAFVTVQVAAHTHFLNRFSPRADLTRTIEEKLGHRLDTYQLIVGRYLWPICQLSIPKHTSTVVDLDDFQYRYARETPWSVSLLKERIKKLVAHRLSKRELKRFNAAFLVSALDDAASSGLVTQHLPNIPVSIKTQPTPPPQGKKLLFVGSLWYRPNSDGVNWFLERVWPIVQRAEPGASIVLAGPASEEVRRQWERHPNVSAPGFVPSLEALYEEATVVVIPIHSGGGSNIKVLECLGYQRVCVASRFVLGAFGKALKEGEHLLGADSPDEFAEKVIDVLRRPDAYAALARQGHGLVSDQFSPVAFARTVVQLVQQTIGTSCLPD